MKTFAHVALLIGLLLMAAAPAFAVDVNVAWNANTETDLAWYRVYQAPGACANPGPFAMAKQVAKPAVSAAIPMTADGTYCFKATAGDTANNESVFSNTAEVVVNTVPPGAPQNLRATVGQ